MNMKLLAILAVFCVVGCENSPISLQSLQNGGGEVSKAQIFLSTSQVPNISPQVPKLGGGGNNEAQTYPFTSYDLQLYSGSATSTPIRTMSFSSDTLLFDTTGLSEVRFLRVIAQPMGEAVKVNSIRFPGGEVLNLTTSQKLLSGGSRVAYAVNFSTRSVPTAGTVNDPTNITGATTRYVQYRLTPVNSVIGNVLDVTGTELGVGKNFKAYRIGSTSQFSLFVLENGQSDSSNGYLSAIRFTSPLSSVQIENVSLSKGQEQDWRHGIFAGSNGFEVRQPGSVQTLNGFVGGIFYPVSIIVQSAGAPVSGANVSMSTMSNSNPTGSYSGTTSSDGVLTLSLPQGLFQMSVQKNGFSSVNRTEQIISGINHISVVLDSSSPPPPPLTSGARIFLDTVNSLVTINGVQRQVRRLFIDSLLFNGLPIVSGARVDIESADLVSAFENIGWTENVSNLGFRRSTRAVVEQNGRKVIYFPVSGNGSYRYVLRSSENSTTIDFVVGQGGTTIIVNNVTVALTRVRPVTNPNGSSMNYELVNLN